MAVSPDMLSVSKIRGIYHRLSQITGYHGLSRVEKIKKNEKNAKNIKKK
jgi:hypothetical protein